MMKRRAFLETFAAVQIASRFILPGITDARRQRVVLLVLLAILSLTSALCHAAGSPEAQDATRRIIEVDFSQVMGTIRPLHGVNCGPIADHWTRDLSRYFRALEIPYVRLHAPNAPGTDCVHIQHIFPDMTADPDDPANYNFRRTDDYIAAVLAVGAKPIYNLGHGNEKGVLRSDHRRSNIPPADFQKWARVCVNIVRHYNEGWANGFHHNIKYWEIWNEPNAQNFWAGTLEQFADLYGIVATALKRHDARLMVGGPASTGDFKFLNGFLALCQQRKLPLDFCSWHSYVQNPVTLLTRAREVQRLLEQHGFPKAENLLTEWSPLPFPFAKMRSDPFVAREFFERTGSSEGGAFDVSVLCFLQDSPVTVATFYSGDTLRWGFIDRNGAPKTSYFAFLAFRHMLDTPRRALAKGNDLDNGFAVLAGLAADNSRAGILISNFRLDCKAYEIRVRGLPWSDATICTRYVVDQHSDINRYDLATVATNQFPAANSFEITTPATTPSVCLLELTKAHGRKTEPASIRTK